MLTQYFRLVALAATPFFVVSALAGPILEDADVKPAPASIGADVPLTYFGPAPSTVKPEFIGPLQLLTAGQVDLESGTITLPLYEGSLPDGRNVWYILTDVDNRDTAASLGLNFSGKIGNGAVGAGARSAILKSDGTLVFNRGTVDFSLERKVVKGTGPNAFPPSVFTPGSKGDAFYSPLVKVTNAGGATYNAPMVAFNVPGSAISSCTSTPDYSKVHDRVVHICPEKRTVTLKLSSGFSFSRPVLYLSTDASDALPAALEGVTEAPALKNIPVGRDDSAFSALERLFTFTNGPTGVENPQRQGLSSALADGRSPLNVLGGIPTIATDYSPLWDLNVGEWTADAIKKGYRSRLTEEFSILGFAQRGFITGPGGAEYGSSGFIVNCPIVHRFL